METMRFLAYPSVKRVNLVLRDDDVAVHKHRRSLEDSAKRNKYAERILNWDQNGDVNVLQVSSLWDAIDRLDVPSESVLWIDGDYSVHSLRKISNDTVLNDRFHAWRELPNALGVAEETSLLSLPLSKESPQNEKGSGNNCSFPLLHEMMMHANYLCYLNHPVVGSDLRNYTTTLANKIDSSDRINKGYNADKISWDTTTLAMGMLLFSVGDGYFVRNAHPSFTDAGSVSDLSKQPHSIASDDPALATHFEDLSRYFGCSCSTSIPRMSLPITRQCSSRLAKSMV